MRIERRIVIQSAFVTASGNGGDERTVLNVVLFEVLFLFGDGKVSP
jgi:hypothetical protein